MTSGMQTIIYPVEDLAKAKALHATLLDDGATTRQPVRDVGGGKRIAMMTDADGDVIGLVQPASATANASCG